ncbi:kinase-like domain-containing protein [Sparassis latifolia]
MSLQVRTSSSSSGSESCSDGLFNYEIHEEIGRGSTSVVYRATCKRGRLRNRLVALKKIILASHNGETEVAHLAPSTALHQALHHPCIVSLLSTFSTPSSHYHVLELCSRGTLSSLLKSRQPSFLSEGELRGVVKSLVDALVYLKKERVLHRDLKASNILLTEDFRIKLSDLGLATQLPSADCTASTFCGSPNYVAPEVISRRPYSFGVDVWSLGCLMVTCMTGIPAFEAPSVHNIFQNICHVSYTLPASTSPEAKDLISSLLRLNPADRIPLQQILLHSFFHPSLPVVPLSLSSFHSEKQPAIHIENIPPPFKPRPGRYPDTLSKVPMSQKEHPLTGPVLNKPRNPMASITNRNSRDLLSNELLQPPGHDLTRRVLSAPQPGRVSTSDFGVPAVFSRIQSVPTTPALTADLESLPSMKTIGTLRDDYSSEPGQDRVPIQHLLLSLPKELNGDNVVKQRPRKYFSNAADSDKRFTPVNSGPPAVSGDKLTGCLPQPGLGSHHWRPFSQPASAVPFGSARPSVFTTSYLAPQTHKIAHGQLVVLPSLSLLVDLREGERRKGRKGDEVLVISSDGKTIDIYSAPHLSTPCCLAEPIATYTLQDLPTRYWKLYDDAGHVVNQLKQRIPKLALHNPENKCTLMANEPLGDIELLFSPLEAHCQKSVQKEGAQMRIRLRRTKRSLEIARCSPRVSKTGTEEWVRKVLTTASRSFDIAEEDWAVLDPIERMGLGHMAAFLRVCETVEALQVDGSALPHVQLQFSPSMDDTLPRPSAKQSKNGRQRLEEVLNRLEGNASPKSQSSVDVIAPSSTCTEHDERLLSTKSVQPSLSLPQRPPKFSYAMSSYSSETQPPSDALSVPVSAHGSSGNRAKTSLTAEGTGVQIRFLPTIGWCIKREIGNAELYQIMFHDGASLEVDPGSDRVQLSSNLGDDLRLTFRDALRDKRLAERMAAFDSFTGLFPK